MVYNFGSFYIYLPIKLYDFLDISKMTNEIIYDMNIFCIAIQKTKKE